jgi:hypothetical protein
METLTRVGLAKHHIKPIKVNQDVIELTDMMGSVSNPNLSEEADRHSSKV